MTAPIERAAEALMEAHNLCGDDRGCFCDDAREMGRQMARIVLNSIDGKREGPVMTAIEPELDRLEALLAEATPGPWSHFRDVRRDGVERSRIGSLDDIAETIEERDAALIVAAVNALPDLIAAARA